MFLEIASSVIATIIITLLIIIWGYLKSNIFNKFILKISGVGIVKIYKNRRESEIFLFKENTNSKKLKIITNRGLPFSEPSLSKNFLSNLESLENCKMLVINPKSIYSRERADEIKKIAKKGWNKNNFSQDIIFVANKLLEIDKVELKYHNEKSIFRFIITTEYIYLSGFLSKRFGKDLPVIKAKKDTLLYDIFERYFDFIWAKSYDNIQDKK